MSTPTSNSWKHLERRPGSAYRQLFVKGTRIRARVIYGLCLSAEEPRTPEEVAADYHLSPEAVREAIAYCQSNPPELEQDYREEALLEGLIKGASEVAGQTVRPPSSPEGRASA